MTDEELIKNVADGDDKAYESLFSKYNHRTYAFILSRLKDPVVATEVNQIVWTKLSTKAHTFDPSKKFFTWMFQITQNAIVDEVRKRKRQKRRTKLSVDDGFASKEKVSLDVLPIEELKYPFREAIELAHIDGLSTKEIAEILEVSHANARQILSRARKKLKELVKNNR